jgi:N-acetylneuraminate synthase/N,N'-diacetyllegionaminate synthase
MIISTGLASLDEMDAALTTAQNHGAAGVALLHCVSSYPAPPEDVNLRKIPALAAVFGCPVGFSDHSLGSVAAVGAVAMGACFIEKHFTLDKNLPGPDHAISADPVELRSLVEALRNVEKCLGESRVAPASSEALGRREFRISCVAALDLPAGHCLERTDVAFRRPGTGLPPQAIDWILGRRLGRHVTTGKPLGPADFV